VGILSAVVLPAPLVLAIGGADLSQRCAIRSKPIGDDGARPAVALHCFLDELQRRGLVPRGGDEGFQHLALMIDGPPEVAHLAIDPHVDLVEMPTPVGVGPHVLDPLSSDLGGEHRAVV
jgi:hypothetical protein